MATRPTLHPVHTVLHRPMRLAGVEARLFIGAFFLTLVVLNVVGWFTWALPWAALTFLATYGLAWRTTRVEPQRIAIWLVESRYLATIRRAQMPRQFDPLAHDPVQMEVR